MNQALQSVTNLLLERRSCRAFLPEIALPGEELRELLTPALRAPSNCNTQPWALHIASGGALERLRARLPADFMAGKLTLDFPYDGKYEGALKERQYASAMALYSAMGITREDKPARHDAFMRNFTFFDAPHVGFFFLPAGFAEREACDLGLFAQSVMLLLDAAGLASCPQTALSFLADAVRDELDIPDTQRLMFGLSFGRPDLTAPANDCATERVHADAGIHLHR